MSYIEFTGIVKPNTRGRNSSRAFAELASAYRRTALDKISTCSASGLILATEGRQKMEHKYSSRLAAEIFADLAYLVRLADDLGLEMVVKGKFTAEFDNDLEKTIELAQLTIEDNKVFLTTDKYNSSGYVIRHGRTVEVRPTGKYAVASDEVTPVKKRKIFGRR